MIKKFFRQVFLTLIFIGIDMRRIVVLRFIGKYLKDRKEFIKLGGKVLNHQVELTGFMDSAGESQGHYFHQDLLVANMIFQNTPNDI